jgi:hypothetical protein
MIAWHRVAFVDVYATAISDVAWSTDALVCIDEVYALPAVLAGAQGALICVGFAVSTTETQRAVARVRGHTVHANTTIFARRRHAFINIRRTKVTFPTGITLAGKACQCRETQTTVSTWGLLAVILSIAAVDAKIIRRTLTYV